MLHSITGQNFKQILPHFSGLRPKSSPSNHQIDSKNEWLLLSARFTTKFELVFVLTLENTFS